MSQDTDAQQAIVTVDSLAAALQHFNITHITALEFFQFTKQAEDGFKEPPAAVPVGGTVITCYESQPLQPMISLDFCPRLRTSIDLTNC